ncbi:efflux RND transporter periplasmic adaptor subunit [Leptospira kmetyi]|uniref:efflux RND transporter periplasmic adaptor subunit n=1 Tax=Leptospira kmetyi TaxID=408139 RepID=UPI0010823E4E|nr:efflux RND transporter periplasmic adaptor subunit [Leptospira kmetyi]TGK15078.1 efflux RND transporter periplasmic adaptor subunit [Leptospira kmetyi]TGK25470.1 efflux RND transporter periplasmic adaptor subunit [Leptospira kmetyi]TGL72801.1 efflux RND transporter periplasmic adaptor subunit [Leptospira kmetyi]
MRQFIKLFKNRIVRVTLYSLIAYGVLFAFYYRLVQNSSNPALNRIGGIVFKPLSFLTKSKNRELEIENIDPISVSILKVQTTNLSPSLSASGSVEYKDKIDVFPKLTGKLEKIYVQEGQEIKIGDKLFKMESLQYELELMKQEATLESSASQVKLAKEKYLKARQNIDIKLKEQQKSTAIFDRTKDELEKARHTFAGKEEIYKVGGLSREEFEAAALELRGKEAALTLAQKDLEIHSLGLRDEDILQNDHAVPSNKEARIKLLKEINTKIEAAELEVANGIYKAHEAQVKSTRILLKEVVSYSPMNGIVAKKYKSEGEVLSSSSGGNQVVMTVMGVNEIIALFNVSESDSIALSTGMSVDFQADVYKSANFTGKIILISPLVDQKAHTVEVKALVKNPDKKLKPGMFIRAKIITGKPEPMMLIPASAVTQAEDGSSSVFIVNNGRCFKTPVKLGSKYDDNVRVLEGLKQDDSVVLDKLSQLRDGTPIKPTFNETWKP